MNSVWNFYETSAVIIPKQNKTDVLVKDLVANQRINHINYLLNSESKMSRVMVKDSMVSKSFRVPTLRMSGLTNGVMDKMKVGIKSRMQVQNFL